MSTGHWLDALLGRSRLQIEWNGTPLTKRDTLAFSDDFEVVDSGANGGRTVVSLAGGGALDGDVTGDTDDNFIIRISGDEEDAAVRVFASAFLWDDSVSDGEAELSVSTDELDGGALQMVHNAKRVLLFASSGAVVGNTTGVNSYVGGERRTVRTISSNITLDTTTKDSIGWIVASSERQVTLPAPSVGRVFFFPTVGGTTPSIRRGSALINGAASNYAMPLDADGGIGVAISDGTNWVVRSIYTPSVSAAAPVEPAMTFFPAVQWQYAPISAAPPADTAGDEEVGVCFTIRPDTATVNITGIRFYWAGTGGQTVRVKLWDTLTSTTVAAKTVDVVTSGAGLYTATFSTPFTVPTNRYMAEFRASTYDLAGLKYTKILSNNTEFTFFQEALPLFGGRRISWRRFNLFHSGAGMPGSDGGTEWALIEPVIEEV